MAEIEFGTFVAPEVENPYTDALAQLIAGGDNASMTITVDATDEKRQRYYIAKAANAQGKTARMRLRDDSKIKMGVNEDGMEYVKGGTVKLTFTLTQKHAPRRGKAEEAVAE